MNVPKAPVERVFELTGLPVEITATITGITAVPEPATLAALLIGISIATARQRRH